MGKKKKHSTTHLNSIRIPDVTRDTDTENKNITSTRSSINVSRSIIMKTKRKRGPQLMDEQATQKKKKSTTPPPSPPTPTRTAATTTSAKKTPAKKTDVTTN